MEIRVECSSRLFKSLIHFLYKIGKLKVRWQDIKDADELVLVLKRPRARKEKAAKRKVRIRWA